MSEEVTKKIRVPQQEENETDKDYQLRLIALVKSKSESFEKSVVQK